MTPRPAMVWTDTSNAFAHNTMKVRVPAIIRDVQALNSDYPPAIQMGLTRLAAELEHNALIPPLDKLAPDAAFWGKFSADHAEQTWLNTDWFFAETYFYRHLLHVVRWWETGRDPFAPHKAAELRGDMLWKLLERALSLRDDPLPDRLAALIHADVWGNRVDLSFAAVLEHGHVGSHEDLLVDDTGEVVERLLAGAGREVHFIADNTGTELAMDMALTDALLDARISPVIFHIKAYPMFVSDITVPDFHHMLAHMRGGDYGAAAQGLGSRLQAAFDDGRLVVMPHLIWNMPTALADLPEPLRSVFDRAALVISKGDLNYRRMVGDLLWAAETPLAEAVGDFAAPLVALRTMKSDLLVGLRPGQAEALDGIDPYWRVNGKRALIQLKP